jgi:hypothetical protein
MQLGIELFRINCKVLRFVIIKVDVIHAYLCCKICYATTAYGDCITNSRSVRNSSPLISYTNCVNKLALCLGNTDGDYKIEEVLTAIFKLV